jgi:hypothetical protein
MIRQFRKGAIAAHRTYRTLSQYAVASPLDFAASAFGWLCLVAALWIAARVVWWLTSIVLMVVA